MLRALLALLALAAPAATWVAADGDASPDESHHAHPSEHDAPVSELFLDASLLPGPTGWFAVPVTAQGDTLVQIATKEEVVHDGAGVKAVMPLLALAPEAPPAWHASVYRGQDLVSASYDGERVGTGLGTLGHVGLVGGGGTGEGTHWLQAGQTLWVGLAAQSWDPAQDVFRMRLRSYEAAIELGEPVTGDGVHAVDLVQDARESGRAVHALGQNVLSEPADVAHEWGSARGGLLVVSYFADGDDVSGTLSVRAPGGVSRVIALRDVVGGFIAAGPGDYAVKLSDLRAPSDAQQWGSQEWQWVQATAMHVDVELPGEGVWEWHDDLAEDDW